MSQATTQTTNRKREAVSCIAIAFGIPEAEITNNMMLGCWAHYIIAIIFFRTRLVVEVQDWGTVTVGDILEQL